MFLFLTNPDLNLNADLYRHLHPGLSNLHLKRGFYLSALARAANLSVIKWLLGLRSGIVFVQKMGESADSLLWWWASCWSDTRARANAYPNRVALDVKKTEIQFPILKVD
jgi:hypothetical protein